MRWSIILIGDSYILQILADTISIDGFQIVKVESDYLLQSQEFENYESDTDVFNHGQEIVSYINGVIFLKYGIPDSIKSDCVIKYRDDGKRDIYITITETIKASVRLYEPTITITTKEGEVIVNRTGQHILEKFFKEKSNEKAKKIFRLIQSGDLSFATIYKIIEILLSEKGSKLYDWVSEKKIKLLKRTANHYVSIGDEARHGDSSEEPPKVPMDIEEARSIVKILINRYIDDLSN